MFSRLAKFVKSLSFIMLSWQGNFLQKRLIKKTGYKPGAAVHGCSVDFKMEAELADIKKLNDEAGAILKRCHNNPLKIIEFIKEHKTDVYIINFNNLIFKFINPEEGFLSSRTGLSALFLSFITIKKFRFKTKPMFILNSDNIDIYNLIHYFHKWLAFKEGLPGFDEKSQKLLKKFNTENEDSIISKLSITDIDLLKAAIARDVQSIDFVSQYSKENAGAKNAYKKLKSDNGANI